MTEPKLDAPRRLTRRAAIAGGAGLLAGCALPEFAGERLLYRDDFRSGLGQWLVEAERPAQVIAAGGVLDVETPRGLTLWFRPELEGPLAIDYDVTPVSEGGPHDEVSDVNCFWMATDPRVPSGNVLARTRSGAFAEYDTLRMYYAGIGGNRNTTSRFRRYVGERDNRPLLPQHDLSAPERLLVPNRRSHIRVIADGHRIALLRDDATMFEYHDPEPYRRGRFGFRTTQSHLRFANFRVWRLG